MKRQLILIQGISTQVDYMTKALKDSGFDTSEFDKIEVVRTEEFFIKHTPWYLKPFKLIPAADSWANRLNDVLVFMSQKNGRIGACRLARLAIRRAQYHGYEPTIVAHSLGTIILLCCGPNELKQDKPYSEQLVRVPKVYLFNSPLGMVFPLGNKVLDFVRRYIQNFLTEELVYVYGAKDMVSKNYQEDNHGQILNLATINKKEIYKEESGHSLSETIRKWQEEIVVI